ncbi:MAG: HdeA/HdeB family chaperone [Alphaproteobacteria bacterium]
MTRNAATTIRLAFALLLGSAVAQPALAQATNMATYTCAMFMAADGEDQVAVAYWIDGYLSRETSDLVVDTATLLDNIFQLREVCPGNPDVRILQFFGF